MASTVALCRKLESDGEPLAKRLCFAHNVIKSSQLPIPGKEEAIIEWLCKVAEKVKKRSNRESITNSQDDMLKLWNTLCSSVGGLNKKTPGFTSLRLNTMSSIVKVLTKHLKRVDLSMDERLSLLDCGETVMKNQRFQRYFLTNINSFSKFSSILIQSLHELDKDHVKVCFHIVSSIHTAVRHNWTISFWSEFRSVFLDDILVPLILVFKHHGNDHTGLTFEVFKFIRLVLFSKTSPDFQKLFGEIFGKKNDADFVQNLSSLKEMYPIPFKLWNVLREAKESLDIDALVNLFRFVFRSFVDSGRTESNPMNFELTVILTYSLGFKVNNPTCKIPYSKLNEMFEAPAAELSVASVEVLHALIETLTQFHPALVGEIRGLSFINWFQMLVSSLFPLPSSLSADMKFMDLITAFIKLSPVIIEPNAKKIMSAVTCKSLSEEEQSTYSNFLSALFSMFVKLNRIPAFLTSFLTCLRDGFQKQKESGASPSRGIVWLPMKVTEELSQSATMVTSLSSIQILKDLLSQLSRHCLASYENEPVKAKCEFRDVFLECVCSLLCAFLKGVRMLDHCQGLQSRQSLCSILKQLKEILSSFGQMILKNSNVNSVLVASFLNTSYHWGALALLVELYADKGREDILEALGSDLKQGCQTPSIGGILSLLHPYLNSSEWESIYELASKCEDGNCETLLVKFDVQLLSAIHMLDSPEIVISKEVAKHICQAMVQKLTDNRDISFLDRSTVSDVFLIVPQLDIVNFVSLSDALTACLIANSSAESFNDTVSLLREERSVTCGLICSVLNSLRRILKVSKRKKNETRDKPWKTSKTVLGKLDAEIMFQVETQEGLDSSEQLISFVSSMASLVEKALLDADRQDQSAVEECEMSEVLQHLKILRSLPLAYLSESSQAVVFLSLFSLALDCMTLPSSLIRVSILKEILDHLLLGLYEKGKLHDPKLEGYIDHGVLISGLARVVINCDAGKHLLVLLLGQAIHQEQSRDQVLEKIILMKKKCLTEEPDKENLLLGTLLMQELSQKTPEQNTVSSKTSPETSLDGRLEKARKRLFKSFAVLVQHNMVNPEDALHAFALTLEFYLMANENVENLTPHLEKSLTKAVSVIKNDEPLDQKSVETLIMVVLEHRLKLAESVPSTYLIDLWSALLSAAAPSNILLTAIYVHASPEEMTTVVKDLLRITQQVYTSGISKEELTEKNLPDMIQFWLLLLKCPFLPDETFKISMKGVRSLFDCLPSLGALPHLQLLEFLHQVVTSSRVKMDKNVIDQCLLIMHEVPLPDKTQDFLPLAHRYLAVLSGLFMHHTLPVCDLIPSFMQLLMPFIKKLGYMSRQRAELSQDDGQKLASLALGVEKLLNFISKPDLNLKDSFRRISAYFMADILSVFENIQLISAVQTNFQNMFFALMKLTDIYARQFLLRVVSPAAAIIFKSHRDTYNKFHAYTAL